MVLDVKVGVGAFMNNLEDAQELARLMVDIAHLAGRKAVALLSDMNQPLGSTVGNALELKEAIETLHGGGPSDFVAHCLEAAAQLLYLGEICPDVESGRQLASQALADGRAWQRFRALVSAQGGDVRFIDQAWPMHRAGLFRKLAPQLDPAAGLDPARTADLAVPLQGVHVTDVEQGAGHIDAELYGCPGGHLLGVEIHAPVARPAVVIALARRGDAHTAQHRCCRELR